MFGRRQPPDPELEALALRLQALPRRPLEPGAAPRVRARVLAQLTPPRSPARVPRLAVAAALAAILAVSGAAAALAAPAALPGDPLYGLKRLEERVELLLTLSPAAAQGVRSRHEVIRAQEAEAIKARQRDAGAQPAAPERETGAPAGSDRPRPSSHQR